METSSRLRVSLRVTRALATRPILSRDVIECPGANIYCSSGALWFGQLLNVKPMPKRTNLVREPPGN